MRRKFKTIDKGHEATPIHTTEQIGPKRALTPEGFLLCADVPIARTGLMLYGAGETPIKTRDGIARVTRDESALFAPDTLASFNGKPVVNDHPDVDVTPNNWKALTIGICMNPRQGVGDNSDIMVADLLITDAAAIRDVQAGKREVSAGYEADYEQTGDGSGRQTSIIGNHIALVEKGRCGPRCAIGDHQPPNLKEHSTMGTKVIKHASRQRRELPAAIRSLFRDALEDMVNPAAAGAGENDDSAMNDTTDIPDENEGNGATHIHIHSGPAPAAAAATVADDVIPGAEDAGAGDQPQDPVEARFQALESGLAQLTAMVQQLLPQDTGGTGGEGDAPGAEDEPAEEDPPADDEPAKTQDKAKASVGDSVALETSFKAILADAEILVPGFRFPTFDAKASRKVTMDSMCATRKKVLETLSSTADGKSMLDSVAGSDFDLSKADCATSAVIFKAAAGAKRAINNNAATKDAKVAAGFNPQVGAVGKITSIADLNKLNAQFWAAKTVAAK